MGTWVDKINHSLSADSYSGQWRCLECDPPSAWDPDPAENGGQPFIRVFVQVGDYEFKGGAHEQTGPAEAEDGFTWSYLTKEVSVVGPDRDELFNMPLTASASSEDPLFMEMDVLFYLYCGTFPIGTSALGVSGDAQERIKRDVQWGGTGQWSDWIGPESGIFELIGVGAIYDFKTAQVTNRAAWDALPVGTVIDEFYQQNRMITTDCGGTPLTYPFAVRHFQKLKSGNTSWSLHEI